MSLATTLLLALVAASSPAQPRKVRNMPDGWTWPPSTAMKEAGARCRAELDAAHVRHRPAARVKKIATPIEIPAMTIHGIALVPLRGEGPFPMDCHLAAAIADVAPELLALGVRSLHFRTLHKYRAVRKRGKSMGFLSRHAVGLAIDVFEVGFADREVLRIKAHWSAAGQRLAKVAAVFEHAATFRTPLTPANDRRDHDDHLHLEAHMHLDSAPEGDASGQRAILREALR